MNEVIIEGKKRLFVPYKGWCIDNMGELVKDPLINICVPPLQIIDDIEKHSEPTQITNNHILYNILDKNGNEILSEWVRNISYINSHEIYLIEDNNEDDLINKYGYLNNDNRKKYNVVTKDGVLLSSEWFEEITPSNGGYLRIKRRGKYNLFDQHGHFLLKDDAEFVSDYLCDYAYCCREGILSIVFPDGSEEAIRVLDVYDESRDGKIKSTWWAKYLRAIYRKTIDEKEEWNYLVNYKKVLFKHYYDKLEASGIHGLYFVWEKGRTKLIDMAENVLTDFSFKLPNASYFLFGYSIIEIEGKYGLINHLGKILIQGFSSVLWAPQKDKLWMMVLFRNGTEKRYLIGQGGPYIHYAHEFLINNQVVCLFEKDNKWYYLNNNKLIELFECAPESIETDNDSI